MCRGQQKVRRASGIAAVALFVVVSLVRTALQSRVPALYRIQPLSLVSASPELHQSPVDVAVGIGAPADAPANPARTAANQKAAEDDEEAEEEGAAAKNGPEEAAAQSRTREEAAANEKATDEGAAGKAVAGDAATEGGAWRKQDGPQMSPACLKDAVEGPARLQRQIRSWQQCGLEPASCGKNFTPFLILEGQTGTTHLAQDVLRKHPELMWIGEGHDSCFLDMVRSGMGLPSPRLAAGTKTQRAESILDERVPPGMRFIHITRLNAIAWGLSTLHKEELLFCTGRGQARGGSGQGQAEMLKSAEAATCTADVYARKKVNITRLRWYVESKVRFERVRNETLRVLEGRGHPVLHISYEDLLADEQRVVDRITRFLGVSPVAAKEGNVAKKGSRDLRGSFTNWAELVAAFCGTELERDLGVAGGGPCAPG
ncbi:unnamed protein product [Prorocentrum cordatum]|uniref:Protein-tyrosine sulfotransferase n=1 Tax=Prorocentrum cordatum TaxID=2364126 RepID=A0ABN9UT54_9DINO|nr:unnamed protein product [Polarella glacialis]